MWEVDGFWTEPLCRLTSQPLLVHLFQHSHLFTQQMCTEHTCQAPLKVLGG